MSLSRGTLGSGQQPGRSSDTALGGGASRAAAGAVQRHELLRGERREDADEGDADPRLGQVQPEDLRSALGGSGVMAQRTII